jgi:hypothetical protein
MRFLRAAPLILAIACGGRPSTVPLGGTEWVKPERHVDRRPRGELGSETVIATVAASPAAVITDATPRQAPAPAAIQPGAQEVRFELKSIANGTVITIDTQFTVKAALTTSVQGTLTSQSFEVEATQQLKARVTDAKGDEIRALELEYVKSTNRLRMPGTDEDDDTSGTGKRYRVTFRDGAGRVEPVGFTLEPDEDKQVLLDLAALTGYWPLVKGNLPASLAPGWKRELGHGELSKIFGAPPSVRLESGRLTLLGRDPGSSDRALFECGLSVELERDGVSVASDLGGKCAVRPSDTRALEVNLSGELRATTNLPFGADATITGKADFRLEQTYGPR